MDVIKLNDGKTEAILCESKPQQSTVNSLGVGESETALCGYRRSQRSGPASGLPQSYSLSLLQTNQEIVRKLSVFLCKAFKIRDTVTT